MPRGKKTKVKKLKKTEVIRGEDIVKETLLTLVLYPKKKDAAEKLKISESGLFWRLREYPEIRERLRQIPEDALATLQAGSIRAAEVYIDNLDNPVKAMDAAREVLDRVGVVKKETPTVAQQFNVGDLKITMGDGKEWK